MRIHAESKVVAKSNIVMNNLNPTWDPFVVEIDACGGMKAPLEVRVYDYDEDGTHDFIGSFGTTLEQLVSQAGASIPLINPNKKGFVARDHSPTCLLEYDQLIAWVCLLCAEDCSPRRRQASSACSRPSRSPSRSPMRTRSHSPAPSSRTRTACSASRVRTSAVTCSRRRGTEDVLTRSRIDPFLVVEKVTAIPDGERIKRQHVCISNQHHQQ